MKIHFIHPFSLEKNYGKELNETMSIIPDGDWCAIMDWDCMLLMSDQIKRIYGYVNKYPETGIFVANSNRSGSLNQRINMCDFDSKGDMIAQHKKSEIVFEMGDTLDIKICDEKISGFLMLISRATWNEIKFNENLAILNVDRDYAKRIIESGKRILLMKTIYVWHSYRIWKNAKDITHLT